jgi:small conductance mechanosensitive channel
MLEYFSPETIAKLMETIITAAPGLIAKGITAALMLLIGNWMIGKVVQLVEKAFALRNLDNSLQTFFISLINIGLKFMLLMTVAQQIGIETTSVVAMFGAASLAIGLALQGSLANFAGGVLILIFKPFKVGDRIKAQDIEGIVSEIQIFNTIIKTPDHKLVIVPNGLLSNGVITNMSSEDVRVDMSLTISGDNDMTKVRAKIMEILLLNPKVARTPEPQIAIMAIDEDDIQIVVRPYTEIDDYWNVHFYAMEGIKTLIDNGDILPASKITRVEMLTSPSKKEVIEVKN